MEAVATTVECPRHAGLIARLRAWLTSRPTPKQRQATVDLRHASEALKHDLGIGDLML